MLTILLIAIAAAAAVWAFQLNARNRTLAGERDQLRDSLLKEAAQKDSARLSQVQSEKEIDLLREQLKYEREQRTGDETRLKEQLTAIANDVVQQGNAAVRTEHRQHLEQLLQPFKDKLHAFESEVRDHKEKGVMQHASLESLVKALSEQHAAMNLSAQNLANALKGDLKTQGNWGEVALERILEISGLHKGSEYVSQSSFRDEDQKVHRPDFLVRLPGEKHIILDSKVSLTAFERYVNAATEEQRTAELKLHVLSVNNHVKQLGEKNYAIGSGLQTPEFVLMFVPMEASFALAIREEPDIYMRAWEKRVVIVTPSTLLATLKTIESIWKQERRNVNAEKIAVEAGRLYDKFVGFIDDLRLVEKHQQNASKSFRDAFSKLSEGPGNVIGKVENLRKLGAKAGKQIDRGLLGDEDQ
jgi:DNA recombination protein RmuC